MRYRELSGGWRYPPFELRLFVDLSSVKFPPIVVQDRVVRNPESCQLIVYLQLSKKETYRASNMFFMVFLR